MTEQRPEDMPPIAVPPAGMDARAHDATVKIEEQEKKPDGVE